MLVISTNAYSKLIEHYNFLFYSIKINSSVLLYFYHLIRVYRRCMGFDGLINRKILEKYQKYGASPFNIIKMVKTYIINNRLFFIGCVSFYHLLGGVPYTHILNKTLISKIHFKKQIRPCYKLSNSTKANILKQSNLFSENCCILVVTTLPDTALGVWLLKNSSKL